MIEAILALGSNLGKKKENLLKAINFIGSIPKTTVLKISKFYETEPFGVQDEQDNYINCCIIVKTQLSAYTLLGACLGIESAMGRKRTCRFSSRNIDIDVILYGDKKISTDELEIPHPRMSERAFVIMPIMDICENGSFYGFDFADMLKNIDTSVIKRVI